MDFLATVSECTKKNNLIPNRSADSVASIALEPGDDQNAAEFWFSEIIVKTPTGSSIEIDLVLPIPTSPLSIADRKSLHQRSLDSGIVWCY